MTELTPYHEDQELDNNTSNNTHFRDILDTHISRRSLIKKTASGAAALALASSKIRLQVVSGQAVLWLSAMLAIVSNIILLFATLFGIYYL